MPAGITSLVLAALPACTAAAPGEMAPPGPSYPPDDAPLQETFHKASHNTYQCDQTLADDIAWHFERYTNHIELDIWDCHTGERPGDWDGDEHDALVGDWWVAHEGDDPVTPWCGAVGRLADCLEVVAAYHDANPEHALISLWIDKKQDWPSLSASAPRSPARLDALLAETLGPALITPADLLARGGGTLRDVVRASGWPRMEDLRGRILVVVTSHPDGDGNARLAAYAGDRGVLARAFVAPYASSAEHISDRVHGFGPAQSEWAVVYNVEWTDDDDDGECDGDRACRLVGDARAQGWLLRAWDLDDPAEYAAARDAGVHFLPVDAPWQLGGSGGFAEPASGRH